MEKTTRPTVAEIDLDAMAFNLDGIRKRVGKNVKIMGVVKANAYGHGLVGISKFIEKHRVDYLGVAFPEEGAQLREAGVRKPIHVLTLAAQSQAELYFRYDLEPSVSAAGDLELLTSVAQRRKRSIPVHVKIDTGMNRIGVKMKELESFLLSLGKHKRLEVKGVFTHFANSDERDKSFAKRQLAEFERAAETVRHLTIEPELMHCANSAAILDLPESYYSMVRPGIMMFGYYPSKETSESIPLRPAMSVKTRVALVKHIDSGESVSYGRRFIAQRRTSLATLPVGYADGYSRLLTGKSAVLINGQKHPVVGTICMDQCMVDCGGSEVRVGDEATLIGAQESQIISAWDIAEKLGTIPYEVCCGVSARVPRIYRN